MNFNTISLEEFCDYDMNYSDFVEFIKQNNYKLYDCNFECVNDDVFLDDLKNGHPVYFSNTKCKLSVHKDNNVVYFEVCE